MKKLQSCTMDGTWVNCDEDNLHSNFYDNTIKYMESLGVSYLTIDYVKYRIVEAPREWWIIKYRDGGVAAQLFDNSEEATEARDKWWPSAEVIHVKEVK